jgi:Uma2 family endonuclease
MTQAKSLTFADYLASTDDLEHRYELTQGELIAVPPESDENIILAMALAAALRQFVSWRLIRTHATTLQVVPMAGIPIQNRLPDLIVLTPELVAQLSAKSSAITLDMPAPALVAEIVSDYASPQDDNYQRDYHDKRLQYENRGIPEYSILDPTGQQVTVCQLVNGCESVKGLSPDMPQTVDADMLKGMEGNTRGAKQPRLPRVHREQRPRHVTTAKSGTREIPSAPRGRG